jgi:sugar lactone lactonase YvrE
MAASAAAGFHLSPNDLKTLGKGLKRPECVLCTEAGHVFVSHREGGVTQIGPDGAQRDILARSEPRALTNGFAITQNGEFLLANLEPPGGVWRLNRDGGQSPFLTEVDGVALDQVNYVGVDVKGRAWVTVSTRRIPRHRAHPQGANDGFVVLVDGKGARIAADGIGYTNEAVADSRGEWLYVNETFARRTSRYRIGADGALGPKEVVYEYGKAEFPDGLALDVEGAFWTTCVVSNSVVRVTADGKGRTVVAENDPAHMDEVEQAYQTGSLSPEHLGRHPARRMKQISSIAFGGEDLKTAYLGNLLDDRIYSFRSPVAGQPMSHWRVAF